MQDIEQLKRIFREISDVDLSHTISHGALEYSDDVAQTVSFTFWICYMAEQDLDTVLKKAWQLPKLAYPEWDHEKLDELIEKDHKIKSKKIDTRNKDYNEREITFGDRIFIKEQLFGKTNSVKLLWKLKNIRNDLSHGRIHNLEYNGENLLLRSAKEKLLTDYFKLIPEKTIDSSPIWQNLSQVQKDDIEKKLNQIMNDRQK